MLDVVLLEGWCLGWSKVWNALRLLPLASFRSMGELCITTKGLMSETCWSWDLLPMLPWALALAEARLNVLPKILLKMPPLPVEAFWFVYCYMFPR